MRNLSTYEKYINESLVILSMDKLMKDEFINNIILKRDFENARRLFYMNGSSLLTHIEGDKFELRTYANFTDEDLTNLIDSQINTSTERMKFTRKGKSKTSILKDKTWLLKCKLI